MRGAFHTKSGQLALGAVLAACSVTVLYLACLVPSGRLGLTAAAGLFPMGALLAVGRQAGLMCWMASGLLAAILLPDKGVALLYLLFWGLYPVAKGRIEGMRKLPLEVLCKLIYFNGALSLFWFGLQSLFLPALPQWILGRTWLLYLSGNLIFLCYDIGLSQLIATIQAKMGKKKRQ